MTSIDPNLEQLKKYFTEVLGVNEIVTVPQADTTSPIARIIFLDDKGVRSKSGTELLEKMIAAMKLSEGEFQIMELELGEITEQINSLEAAQHVVCFSKKLSDFIQNNFPRINLQKTYGPEEMLANPELKRDVWTLLKSIM